MSDPFSPARLGPVTLRNRVIKAATSEGRSPDGAVTDELIDFHRSFAEGGVGMTTVAYCCVSPQAASAPGQIVMSVAALPGLRRLTDAVHDAGAAISAQLGHAGVVAPRKLTGVTAVAPSKPANPRPRHGDRQDERHVRIEPAKRPRSAKGCTIEITRVPEGRRTRLISFSAAGTSSTSINTL